MDTDHKIFRHTFIDTFGEFYYLILKDCQKTL
jgi:hypothetical protein